MKRQILIVFGMFPMAFIPILLHFVDLSLHQIDDVNMICFPPLSLLRANCVIFIFGKEVGLTAVRRATCRIIIVGNVRGLERESDSNS